MTGNLTLSSLTSFFVRNASLKNLFLPGRYHRSKQASRQRRAGGDSLEFHSSTRAVCD